MTKSLDVVGICNALVDILVTVEDQDLKALELTKGMMHLVDDARQAHVLNYFSGKPQVTELGGSAKRYPHLGSAWQKDGLCRHGRRRQLWRTH